VGFDVMTGGATVNTGFGNGRESH